MFRSLASKYVSYLAFKYVGRVITVAALLGVAYSVTLLIVVVSVMEGFRTELENRVRGTTSDIRIESNIFVGLENPDRLRKILEDVPGIQSSAPIVETLALYRRLFPWPSEDASDRLLLAMDFSNEDSRREMNEYLAAVQPPTGEPFRPRDQKLVEAMPDSIDVLMSDDWLEKGLRQALDDFRFRMGSTVDWTNFSPAIVGSESLRQEGLLLGSRFELTSFSPVPPHEPRSKNFIVVGYFKTGLYDLDAKGIMLDMRTADEFLNLRGDRPQENDGALRVSAIRTRVAPEWDNEEKMKELRGEIEVALKDNKILFTKVQTWREARNALLQAVKVEKFLVSIILGVVILFAGFMIFIILTVQVVERSRDIGVLISIGATARGIALSYFVIGFSLCSIGTFLGVIYGFGFAKYINTIQRWIKLLTGYEVFPQEVYYLDSIPVSFNPQDIFFIIVPTVAASLVASLVPAMRAASKDPIVTLRYK
ncbi:MAG: FtsX-like permease family protein [Planctomycetota bacterium]